MKIDLVYKFKDGLHCTVGISDDDKIEGDGDLLRAIIKGRKNNSTITMTQQGLQIIKRYDELSSVEIVIVE